MPAKSKSPEAAQKKVWKAELNALLKNHRKVKADANKAMLSERKEFLAAERKYKAALKRIPIVSHRALTNIERRIGILTGRLGA